MTNLPATYEEALAEQAMPLIERIQHKLREDAAAIETMLCQILMRPDFDDREGVIKSAEAGDPLAHAALWKVYRNLRDLGAEPPKSIEVYCLRHTAPPKGRGRFKRSFAFGNPAVAVSHIHRAIGLVALAALIASTFTLLPTRNTATEGPSGVSVAVLALAKRRFHISESEFNKLFSRWSPVIASSLLRRM